ncbi:uncharacterized protein LOC134701659 [Mytilus trossulus]|uniref:uncharacterized protein LOC134701659 n=1 Tax=Mytilus trossulus TaxID=6551 RepID=UPI003004358F
MSMHDLGHSGNVGLSKYHSVRGESFLAIRSCQVQVIGSNDYVGCFIDTNIRLLPHEYVLDDLSNPSDMENNLCLLYCKEQGYMYSGTEVSKECHCGNDPYQYGPEDVNDYYLKGDFDCDFECRGDSEQICGGGWRLSVYETVSSTVIVSNDYVGCFIDTPLRLLSHQYKLNGSDPPDMENNKCLLYCKEQDYMYSGTQVGRQCFCGDDPYTYGPEDVSEGYIRNYTCDRQCGGDSEQICGGGWRLSVYETGYISLTQGQVQFKLISNGTFITASANQVMKSSSKIDCALYCKISDSCKVFVISTETGECRSFSDVDFAVSFVKSSMAMKLFALLMCVYSTESLKCQVQVIDSNDYVGCFVDTRTRLLPHKYWLNGNNPPDMENNLCLLYCKEQGYMYFGTQATRQCFCGDDPYQYGPGDVADYYLGDNDCDQQCRGDSEQICGGGWRLSVYETGTM